MPKEGRDELSALNLIEICRSPISTEAEENAIAMLAGNVGDSRSVEIVDLEGKKKKIELKGDVEITRERAVAEWREFRELIYTTAARMMPKVSDLGKCAMDDIESQNMLSSEEKRVTADLVSPLIICYEF